MSVFSKLRLPSWRNLFNFLPKRQSDTDAPSTCEPHLGSVADVPSPVDAGMISEAGEDRTTLKVTQHPNGGNPSREQNRPTAIPDLRWDELITQLDPERWRPMSPSTNFDEIRKEQITTGFMLNHIDNTLFVSDRDTHGTVCHCKEGVFYFDMDFDSACCVSKTVNGALTYLKNPGSTKPIGPLRRRRDKPYDFDGEDDISDTDESSSEAED